MRGAGRWLATSALVAAASFAAVFVVRSWEPSLPRADIARYPEVASADPDQVRRFWPALDRGRTALSAVDPSEDDTHEPLFSAFRDAPGPATDALLRVLCVWRYQPPFELMIDTGERDAPSSPLAVLLCENADAADLDVLNRIATDTTLAPQVRRLAVDAIARPNDRAAQAVLEYLALERRLEPWVRRLAIERLPRLHASLSPRIRTLLDEPFGRLDECAALALLRTGDREAPSLAVESLRSLSREWDRGWADAACEALLPLVYGDAEMEARLTGVTSAWDAGIAADAMEAWIDANPERFDSDFERTRRESRVREPPGVSFDVIAASDTSFDLGAALIHSDGLPGSAALELGRLDRLARAVRRDAGSDPTPERWIDAMNERLLRCGIAAEGRRQESEVRYVLRTGYGDCMGRSSLYLAVAERLGLPIHGVQTPSHVFVRWDDGTYRRNIECTEFGFERTDASYDGREGLVLAAADVASGAYLRNLQKRQFLALALVNRAARFRAEDDLLTAARAYHDSLRLDPRCAAALIRRSQLRALSPDAQTRAAGAADARAALSICSLVPHEADFAADALFADGAPGEVLQLADAVASAYPKSAVVTALRAKALLRLGRRDDACAIVRAALAWAGDDFWARLNCAQLLVVAGDPAWRRAFDSGLVPRLALHAHLELTKRLLDGAPWHAPLPASASECLTNAEASLTDAKGRHDWMVREMQPRVIELRSRCRLALEAAGAAAPEGR